VEKHFSGPNFRRRSAQIVSAIITAYNAAAFVGEAIESVLAQTRPPDEVVVIDDGSTDNTAEVAGQFARDGVRCVRQENRGATGARNRGIMETRGDMIAFLDCDDLWLPEKTVLQEKYLTAHPEVGLVTSHVWWWDPRQNKCWVARIRTRRSAGAALRELAVRNNIGNPSGVMIRRQLFQQVGLFDPRQWAEDRELWIRVAAHSRIGLINRPLMVYRVTPTGLSHQSLQQRSEGHYQLSRQAIRRIRPAFWRPLLLIRAWSDREFFRADHAQRERRRWAYLLHASLSLLSNPLEHSAPKLKHVTRALIGESLYKLYSLLRPSRVQPAPLDASIRRMIQGS
jgi:glycosyltransferase involved in cell wall biosynthesis